MTFQYIFLFKIKNVSFYLQTRSIALARKQVWLRGVALNGHRRSLLIWLLERMLRTLTVGKSIYIYALLLFILCISLQSASNTGPLFSFVPEVYVNTLPILLDAVMDFSHHDLKAQFEGRHANRVGLKLLSVQRKQRCGGYQIQLWLRWQQAADLAYIHQEVSFFINNFI